jgi:hypothetical protein
MGTPVVGKLLVTRRDAGGERGYLPWPRVAVVNSPSDPLPSTPDYLLVAKRDAGGEHDAPIFSLRIRPGSPACERDTHVWLAIIVPHALPSPGTFDQTSQ